MKYLVNYNVFYGVYIMGMNIRNNYCDWQTDGHTTTAYIPRYHRVAR